MCHSSSFPNNPNNNIFTTPLIPKAQTQTLALLNNTNNPKNNQKPQNSTINKIIKEAKHITKLSLPMALTGLLLYSRSLISTLFLGRLGHLPLAGGSLAIAFANITAYSLLSGLSSGMEPICSQAFGAKRFKLLSLTMQKTTLLLLLVSLPIAFLWLNIEAILIFLNQPPDIAAEAQTYILYSLPDLIAQSMLHPLRIYLRSQSITLPLTLCAGFAILLHIPINYLLVHFFELGLKGVALSGVWTNFNLVGSLVLYVIVSKVYDKTWCGVSTECLKDWRPLISLAVPSCVSVCLEWWWYEIMILLCGLLANPQSTVGSMGVLIQTTAFLYIFPSSLSFGVSTRVGNELGANRPNRAKLAAQVGICISFALGLVALLFATMVRNSWARMFTKDAEIIALTSMVLPIIGLCELGNCPQTTGCGVLRGSARPSLGANVNLGCFYGVGMPVAIWLSFYKGIDFKGLWIGLLVAQGCCVVTMMVVLGRTNWEAQAQRAKQLTGINNNNNNNNNENNIIDCESQDIVGKLKEEKILQQQRCSIDHLDDSPV